MSEKSKQLSFVIDDEALAVIDGLKTDLKAETAAQVVRKALALAKVVADQAKGSDGIVTVRGRSQPQGDEISVALRS